MYNTLRYNTIYNTIEYTAVYLWHATKGHGRSCEALRIKFIKQHTCNNSTNNMQHHTINKNTTKNVNILRRVAKGCATHSASN